MCGGKTNVGDPAGELRCINAAVACFSYSVLAECSHLEISPEAQTKCVETVGP